MYGDERLLQEQSIAELRELVKDLHAKADSKKEELQLMVGSKYHEFIQSADTIATMKDDTKRLGDKLGDFSGSCVDLIAQMKTLLAEHVGERKLVSDSQNKKEVKEESRHSMVAVEKLDITSSTIWARLDQCDVYTAAKVVILAEVLKSAREGMDSVKKNAFVGEFFHHQKITATSLDSDDDDYTKHESASFLAETVVEDGFLILLNNESNIDQKAEIISSLGILSGKSSMDLLKGYLHCADIMMEDITTSLQSGTPGAGVAAAENEADEIGATASKFLLKLVSCLQEMILDVHVLFFPSYSSNRKDKNTLVDRCQIRFLSDLDRQFEYHLGCSHMVDVETASAKRQNISADATSVKNMRDLFSEWFQGAIRKVTALSDRALATMDSAVDVSHLQNQVWEIATFSSAQSPSFTTEDWNSASLKLLVPANKSRDYSSADAGSLLWSTALRAPFISHVERLLRSSCVTVLSRTKDKLLVYLRESDITVDASSLDLHVFDADNGSGGMEDKFLNSLEKGGLTKARMTSAAIFKKAEEIRAVFEAEILDMLIDVKSDPSKAGGGGSDPQSHTALTKAIFVQSSQLIGHFLILLRTLSEKFIKAIDKRRVEVVNGSSKGTNGGALFSVPLFDDKWVGLQSVGGLSNTDVYQDDQVATLLSGLLLMGRISWCLKHRGGRLWSAIESQRQDYFRDQGSTKGGGAFKRFDLSSEDQLRSAFEIADANGDGILSVDEAMEAIQAINVSSYKTSTDEDDSALFDFLSTTLTPSLSLQELALMCGDLLTPEATVPVARCHVCLDSLIEQAHLHWSDTITKDLARSLASNLAVELGADSTAGAGVCKSLWKKSYLQLEDGPDEVVEIPTSCSSSLTSFLALLSTRSAYGAFSVDTTQEILSHAFLVGGNSNDSSSMIDSCLANSIFRDLRKKAIPSVLRSYSSVYKAILASASSASATATTATAKKRVETWREDCALQVLFDLDVIEKVADREYLSTKNGQTMVKKSTDTWKSLIDPINLELLLPAVTAQVDNHLSTSRSILAGANVFGSITAFDALASSNVTDNRDEGEKERKSDVFLSIHSPKLALLPSSISTIAVGIVANSKANAIDDAGRPTSSSRAPAASSSSSSASASSSLNVVEEALSEEDNRNLSLRKYLSFFNT